VEPCRTPTPETFECPFLAPRLTQVLDDVVVATASVNVLAALVAGTLLCAGMAKLAVPAHLTRAIHDLAPGLTSSGTSLARVVAVAELGTAAALSVPGTRRVGAAAGVFLGLAFALVGLLALRRHVSTPCGCFGRGGGKPLGAHNVFLGIALAVVCAMLWWVSPHFWWSRVELPVLASAAVAIVLTAWLNRRMIGDLAPPVAFLTRRGPDMRSAG